MCRRGLKWKTRNILRDFFHLAILKTLYDDLPFAIFSRPVEDPCRTRRRHTLSSPVSDSTDTMSKWMMAFQFTKSGSAV